MARREAGDGAAYQRALASQDLSIGPRHIHPVLQDILPIANLYGS
jgi:hypothetical protein